MGFDIGSFFEPSVSGQGFQKIPLTDDEKTALQYLMDLVTGDLKVPTKATPELTDVQQAGRTLVQSIVSGTGDMGLAVKEFQDTLSASRDLSKLPEFKAISKLVDTSTDKQLSKISRYMNMKGNLSTGKAGQTLLETVGQAGAQKTAALAPYAESNLNRRLSAANSLISSIFQRSGASQLDPEATRQAQIAENEYAAEYENTMLPYTAKAGIASSILNSPFYQYNPGFAGPSQATQTAQLITSFANLAQAGNPFSFGGLASVNSGGTTAG